MRTPESYQYLNQSGCTTLDGVDDADKFDALRLALEIVQIPKETKLTKTSTFNIPFKIKVYRP